MEQLKGILTLEYEIEVITGLHIGGSKESIEIGGIDNPVIKLRSYKGRSDVPYIPGSSIKGKIRSLLELAMGKGKDPCSCGECSICKLFGTAGTNAKHPIRLRVSDFYPTDDTLKFWEDVLEGLYTEIKAENTIDRITSTVKRGGLRQMERVIPESRFEGVFIIRIFNQKEDKNLCELLIRGIELLQDDYLGGSGSRGYGRVEFHFKNAVYKKIAIQSGILQILEQQILKQEISDPENICKYIHV